MSGCPACGGALTPWIEVPAFESGDERRFPLLRCNRCRSAVTGGEPPGPEAYSAGLYDERPPPAALTRARRLALRQPAAWLRRGGLPPGGRLLDVGAGRGLLVEELRRAGYDARGIDPAGRATAGSAIERRALGDHTDADLDAVVMWHVLEHLDDPRAALERARSWLRPGGLLLVGVPNIASLQAAVGGSGWLHLDAPRHRVHLTPAGLRALLADSGFSPGKAHHHVPEHNPAGMWMALLARAGMQPGLPFHLLKRNATARPRDLALLAAGIPLAAPAIALEGLAGLAGRGGTIAAEARRV